jgi:hypothetical protein
MTHPTNLVTADMNGDGTLDLVCITNGNEYVQVFVADGAWHFTPTASVFMESISRMVAGDFNRDGKTDVLVNSTFSATLLPGDGAGRLGSPQQVVPGIYSAAVGDFNEDGVADVLQTRDGFVGVTFGPIPSGTPRVAFDFDDSPQAGEQRGSINAVAAADVNRDGHQDAVMLDGSGTPWVAFGDGAGRFSAPVRFAAPIANESGAWTVLSADVNGDGYADVIGGMTAGDPTWGAQPGDGYVMLYGPTTADRARTTETLVTKIDGTVDSLANLLTTTSVSLDRLSTVDFSRMANLDAAVSSRASQQSVNGLATAIGDIRAGLAGLPDGSALQATIRDEAASTRSKVDAASDAATRIAIERALGDGVTVIWFMLPASQNGQLDAVREIVAESITGLEVIGVRIPKASALAFSNAEQLFMAGDYARAYKQYAQAYQALK